MTIILFLDIIIAFVVIETAAIAWRRYSRGEMSAFPGDLGYLGSGFLLMLAVRLAWTNESAALVMVLITLAGIVHAFVMIRRF